MKFNSQVYGNYLFDRLNTKYNRLWQQLTDLFILEVQILAGYSFAVLAYNTSNINSITLLQVISLVVLFIFVLVGFFMGRLELERVLTKRSLYYYLMKSNGKIN